MIDLHKYTKTELDRLLTNIRVIVDTREHEGKNDHILNYFDSKGIQWIKRKLEYGDYSVELLKNEELGITRNLSFENHVVIERKNSIEEVCSNLVKDRERLKREFTLSPETKVLMIENANYSDVIMGNYNSKYDKKSLFATLHSFWHEYNIPIMFVPDNRFSGVFIYGFLYYYLRDYIK